VNNHKPMKYLTIFLFPLLLLTFSTTNSFARDLLRDLPQPRFDKENNEKDKKHKHPSKKFDAPKLKPIEKPFKSPQLRQEPRRHKSEQGLRQKIEPGSSRHKLRPKDSQTRQSKPVNSKERPPTTMRVTPLVPKAKHQPAPTRKSQSEPRSEPKLSTPRLSEPRLSEPRLSKPRLDTPGLSKPNQDKRSKPKEKSWNNLLDMPDAHGVIRLPGNTHKSGSSSNLKIPKPIPPARLLEHWQDSIIAKHRHKHSHRGESHHHYHQDHGPHYDYYHRHRYVYYRTPWYNTWYLAPIFVQLPLVGDSVNNLPRDAVTLHVDGDDYFYHEGVFYYQYRDQYVVVSAPIGAEIELLPLNVIAFSLDQNNYYFANNTYYIWSESHETFVVVDQPAGAAPAIAESTALRLWITPRRNQNIKRQSRDRFECHDSAVARTGIDPTLETHDYHWRDIQHYQNSMARCLEDRGYIVR